MEKYVIKATGPRDWHSYKACEMGISIGNPCHSGIKLYSMLEWAFKRFERVYITLSDSLYRYTLEEKGCNSYLSWHQANMKGNEWLEKNRPVLRMFSGSRLTVFRWDHWLAHPRYEAVKTELIQYEREDASFRQALDYDAYTFISRKIKRGESFDRDQALASSKNFLIEEIACYILIARDLRALRAYPGRDMLSFGHMRRPELPESLKGLEFSPHIELNFKKKVRVPVCISAPAAIEDERNSSYSEAVKLPLA